MALSEGKSCAGWPCCPTRKSLREFPGASPLPLTSTDRAASHAEAQLRSLPAGNSARRHSARVGRRAGRSPPVALAPNGVRAPALRCRTTSPRFPRPMRQAQRRAWRRRRALEGQSPRSVRCTRKENRRSMRRDDLVLGLHKDHGQAHPQKHTGQHLARSCHPTVTPPRATHWTRFRRTGHIVDREWWTTFDTCHLSGVQ